MLSSASFANEYIYVKIYIHKTLCFFFINMANLLSLSEEFPHLSDRDWDVLVSLLGESLIKMASETVALNDGR